MWVHARERSAKPLASRAIQPAGDTIAIKLILIANRASLVQELDLRCQVANADRGSPDRRQRIHFRARRIARGQWRERAGSRFMKLPFI